MANHPGGVVDTTSLDTMARADKITSNRVNDLSRKESRNLLPPHSGSSVYPYGRTNFYRTSVSRRRFNLSIA